MVLDWYHTDKIIRGKRKSPNGVSPLGLLNFNPVLNLHGFLIVVRNDENVEKENPSATVVQSTVGVRRDPVVLLDLLWVSGRPEVRVGVKHQPESIKWFLFIPPEGPERAPDSP